MGMEHVLVTGATGFIGNYVVEELLKRGFRVTATSANAEKAASLPWFNAVKYIPFQLGAIDPAVQYLELFGRPDRLIHLAWEGLPNYKSEFHISENLPRHKAFLEKLVSEGLTDITVTGTCFEYGMQEGALREDMPAKPANPYALAKDELRKYLENLQVTRPFNLKWVRLFYMFGKGQSPNSLLSQLDRALAAGETSFNMSGGEQTRDYLPVEKVASYLVSIAGQSATGGIINCCSGVPVTVKELVENHLKQQHKSITLNLGYYPYPDYEPMHFWGNQEKLNKIISNE